MNIKEIAALAGVSVATVSKVLNQKDREISDETRNRVLRVVKDSGYVPYSKRYKSNLQSNHLLGVLISKSHADYNEVVHSIQSAAAAENFAVVTCQLEDFPQQMKILQCNHVDGMILVGSPQSYHSVVEDIQIKQIPCVVVADMPQQNHVFPTVYCQADEAAYAAVSYLIGKGHRKIGCLVGAGSSMTEGYRRALYENNIEFNQSDIFQGDITDSKTQALLDEWLKNGYTAIFCQGSGQVIYIYRRLKENGMAIPGDCSIMAGTDCTYFSLLNPPVTAVKPYFDRVGEQAVARVIELIRKQVVIPTKDAEEVTIVERESVSPPLKEHGKKIVVVGSVNMDETISVGRLPMEGETMIARGVTLLPGGKGANQAVGVGKLGGAAYLIGCVGSDTAGKEIYNHLLNCRVKTDGIRFVDEMCTGKAYINVPIHAAGESTIVVYAGANRQLNVEYIRQQQALFDHAKYCLLSMEIPQETAAYTIQMCSERKIPVILKPAGVDSIHKDLLEAVTYFVPNQKELHALVPGTGTVEQKVESLYQLGIPNIIVTLGKDGCYLKNSEYAKHFQAAPFKATDSTGGADAFISTLAVYLSEGAPLVQAIGFATYSAGICVTQWGVQSAMTTRAALEMYRAEIMEKFRP